jgi:parallel beta-helix repeat protein
LALLVRGKVASIFILVLMLLMIFSLSSIKNATSTSSVNTIVVPTDYPTIQAAIDAAPDNSTITVKPGNYAECITIRKSLNLIGSGADSTTIESIGQAHTVEIPPGVNNVVLEGFTIQGNGEAPWSGIYARESHNDTFANNVVKGHYYGIQIYDSSRTVLKNNTLAGNAFNLRVWGLLLSHFLHDIDTSNSVDGKPVIYWINQKNKRVPSDAGCVELVNCTRISVNGLDLSKNLAGVFLGYTTNSFVTNVTASNNEMGLYMICSYNNTVLGNDFSDNSWDGISTVSAINNTIEGNKISHNGQDGVRLSHSYPILFSYSENNTFSDNVVNGNWDGIYLEKTFRNVIDGNMVEENVHSGITLDESSGNSLHRNTVKNNQYGVWTYTSRDSLFHNNFVNNSVQVGSYPFLTPSSNVWDDGYASGGNYWSNYNGSDSYSGPFQNETGYDWIGDSPYVIDQNNVDRYPLMYLFVQETEEIRTKYRKLLLEYDDLHLDFKSLNSTLNAFLMNFTDLLSKYSSLNSSIGNAEEQIDLLNSTCRKLKESISELMWTFNSTRDSLQGQINSLNQTCISLDQSIIDFQRQFSQLNMTLLASISNVQEQQKGLGNQVSTIQNELYIFGALIIIAVAVIVFVDLRRPRTETKTEKELRKTSIMR